MSALEELATADPVRLAAGWIGGLQTPDGMIPWFRGGHADPWNHVEAAMALAAVGELAAAERAYRWLLTTQDADGGFPASYTDTGAVRESHRDTNAVAYLACGLYHHLLATGSARLARECFDALEGALGFVLEHQHENGAFAWSIDHDGSSSGDALLAASSAIHLSLGAAIHLARSLGADPARYEQARARLGVAIRTRPEAFLDKSAFAMDWYYPVLGGALRGAPARRRLESGRAAFVEPGFGVRCRSDGRWVTAAETAECALAHLRLGELAPARALVAGARLLVTGDGAVRTGLVHPERREFPPGESTTYSAAALVLADDALRGGPSAELFRV